MSIHKEDTEQEEGIDLTTSEEELGELGGIGNINTDKEEEEENKEEQEGVEYTEHDIEDEDEDEVSSTEKSDKLAQLNAQLLAEEGIIDSADGIKTMADLKARLDVNKDNLIEEYLDQLPAELAEQIRAYERGANLSEVKDTVSTIASLKATTDDSIKKDKTTAEKLYRELLVLEGNDQEYIDEMVALAKDSDTLVKQGIRARNRMLQTHTVELQKKEEEAQKKRQREQEGQSKWVETLNKAIDSESIWDIKLTPKERKEIKSILFDPVETQTAGGQKINITKMQKLFNEDPTVLVQIALGIQRGMFGKEGKLTLAQSKAKRAVMEELEKTLEVKGRGKDVSSSNGSKDIASYGASLKAITSMFNSLKL